MLYRKLGKSDLEVSAITFGAWAAGGWMWGSTDMNEAVEAIKASYDAGVTSIDTAPIYGQGTSEEIVGEAIKGISRDQVQILTKFGMRWDLAKGDFAMHSKNNSGEDIDVYMPAETASSMSVNRVLKDWAPITSICTRSTGRTLLPPSMKLLKRYPD